MVANYWFSDAVFVEGLSNKEDVNDKVNKRVGGKIMDPFKKELNLLWGISSISFPRQGTNEDEWEEGRKDKQTYLEISTQIKCASVVNSCTTLSIQRLRRIKLYLFSSIQFVVLLHILQDILLGVMTDKTSREALRIRTPIFLLEKPYMFCATLSRAIVHPEPVVSVLHYVIICTMSIFCHIFMCLK